MLLKLRLIVVALLSTTPSLAQIVVKGEVRNAQSSQAIGYANIGILNSAIGTLSDLDGSFTILIPKEFESDTLTISALGFEKKGLPITQLIQTENKIVSLEERFEELNAITVTAKKIENRTYELGNSKYQGGVMEPDSVYAGRAISLLIENKGKNSYEELQFPLYISKTRIRILRNNLKTFKFRVRINEVDPATGTPGKDLISKSLVKTSDMRNGWLDFDLSDLNLQVSGPFFITFEQILDAKDRKNIADSYAEFIRENPKKLVVDTVEFEGEKQVRQMLRGGGIDLPGTFIAIASKESIQKDHISYSRETSLGEWKKISGILAATVTLSNHSVISIPANDAIENPAILQASQLLEDFMNETDASGVQAMVSKADSIVWRKNVGYSDLESQIPVNDSTRFRLNSVSKTMTGAALAIMANLGILDLDAAIQTYLPNYPVKKWDFNSRQLAGHLAGIRDYNEHDLSDFIREDHYRTAQEFLPQIQNDTLLFEPSSRFHYSTFGFSILGAIIEKVSGESYSEYMQKNLWKPIGLAHTSIDDITKKDPNRSKFYDLDGKENDLGDWSYKYAGAGILSTAEDLVKFGNEILNGALIDQKTKKLLFTDQVTNSGEVIGYGLGWYLGKDKNGHRFWHHAGDSFSSSSFILIYPDDDLVVAFLSNSQHGAAFDVEKLASLFYQ
ncbi:serine hydrolase [Algoriphagus sp. D3-2-R+10]|uniref:serine hydrolase n=1 Tax=Algoriphagus aurantiacus TaxID=3103948 RepID=UPI002B3B3848|nr:serine hydrolase [Algoriphagus sp. D3-2-R+10]MEB2775901.1 serine hydrolase [Algoriphagus sp. D3-2-R+10]